MARRIGQRLHQLYSLDTLARALPEFFEVSAPQGLVDKAFHDSFVAKNDDMRHWKAFRTEYLAQQPRLTPRELARLKFALSHRGEDQTSYANYGRSLFHSKLEEEVRQFLPHMTAHELLSVMLGFSANRRPALYNDAFARLKEEIKGEENLEILALAPYVVARFAPAPKKPHEEWYPNTSTNLDFADVVTPLLINRLTEFSVSQLATICSGLSSMKLHPKMRTGVAELVTSIEEEILYRRVNTLSGENLVDVLKCFADVNLGSDQIFSAFSGKLAQTLEEVDIDAALDLAHSLVSREMLPNEILGRFNKRLLKDMLQLRPSYVGKLAEYLFFIQTNDRPLLSSFVKYIEGVPVSSLHYAKVRNLKVWMEAKHSSIFTPLFHQNADKRRDKFWANDLVDYNPEYKTKEFETFTGILGQGLRYRFMKRYVYENIWYTDNAFMPEKVGINLAQPDFHLIGNVVYDHRIVKEPAYRYRPKHSFKMKGEALKLFGWKVIEFNYHELLENTNRVDREKLIKDTLSKHGIEPVAP
mmetsp:Transcript_25634/g.44859  ORF Transcript_25634/g.44859 Transcript_25634/m.44859 type:complete len:528 (+) Transcript_25634:819-2402(+)